MPDDCLQAEHGIKDRNVSIALDEGHHLISDGVAGHELRRKRHTCTQQSCWGGSNLCQKIDRALIHAANGFGNVGIDLVDLALAVLEHRDFIRPKLEPVLAEDREGFRLCRVNAVFFQDLTDLGLAHFNGLGGAIRLDHKALAFGGLCRKIHHCGHHPVLFGDVHEQVDVLHDGFDGINDVEIRTSNALDRIANVKPCRLRGTARIIKHAEEGDVGLIGLKHHVIRFFRYDARVQKVLGHRVLVFDKLPEGFLELSAALFDNLARSFNVEATGNAATFKFNGALCNGVCLEGINVIANRSQDCFQAGTSALKVAEVGGAIFKESICTTNVARRQTRHLVGVLVGRDVLTTKGFGKDLQRMETIHIVSVDLGTLGQLHSLFGRLDPAKDFFLGIRERLGNLGLFRRLQFDRSNHSHLFGRALRRKQDFSVVSQDGLLVGRVGIGITQDVERLLARLGIDVLQLGGDFCTSLHAAKQDRSISKVGDLGHLAFKGTAKRCHRCDLGAKICGRADYGGRHGR